MNFIDDYVWDDKPVITRKKPKLNICPTKAQRERWGKIAELGCIVCGSPAEIHHAQVTMGMRKNHDNVLPLCDFCHRNGGYGYAIHAGKTEWEARHGTEAALLEKVSRLVDV